MARVTALSPAGDRNDLRTGGICYRLCRPLPLVARQHRGARRAIQNLRPNAQIGKDLMELLSIVTGLRRHKATSGLIALQVALTLCIVSNALIRRP